MQTTHKSSMSSKKKSATSTKSAVTRQEAKELLALLDSLILENTEPLTEAEKNKSRSMIARIGKYINKSGSETDELRGKFVRIEKELAQERERTTSLEKRVKTMETEDKSQSALIKANELATLFRAYFLDLDWGAVTMEFSIQRDAHENKTLSLGEFQEFKATFNAKYPTPEGSPELSVMIEMCQARHEVAHSGGVKTVVRQEKFIAECAQFFAECGGASKYTAPCLAMLQKLQQVQKTSGLHGLN